MRTTASQLTVYGYISTLCIKYMLFSVVFIALSNFTATVSSVYKKDLMKESFVSSSVITTSTPCSRYAKSSIILSDYLKLELSLFVCLFILQYNGSLYLLATDQGFISQTDLVWQKLDEVCLILCYVIVLFSLETKIPTDLFILNWQPSGEWRWGFSYKQLHTI